MTEVSLLCTRAPRGRCQQKLTGARRASRGEGHSPYSIASDRYVLFPLDLAPGTWLMLYMKCILFFTVTALPKNSGRFL